MGKNVGTGLAAKLMLAATGQPFISCRNISAAAQAFGLGTGYSLLFRTTADRASSSALATTSHARHVRCAHSQAEPVVPEVDLANLRDNPAATKQRIRIGRGDSSRRGNYSGRGMKGQKARGGPHLLYDGGTLQLIKFPVTRERAPYEVLYNQVSTNLLVEYIQLGLLDPSKTITMKDLQDVGVTRGPIKYGVLLYGKAMRPLGFPISIEVTACDEEAKLAIEQAGGSVTRVYYTQEGLDAILNPTKYTSRSLPLPLPAHSWHPRYNGRFDKVGQIPPA